MKRTKKCKNCKKNMKVKQAISIILEDIRKNAISKEHRKAEISPDCFECQMRMLEGLLEKYLSILAIAQN